MITGYEFLLIILHLHFYLSANQMGRPIPVFYYHDRRME